ncbi:MAG: OmpA family protein [Crocinitomix sp.]|nr:OmpA family protein [Crocinitomix sp.]
MKLTYGLLFYIATILVLSSCGANYHFKKGDTHYDYLRYAEAIESYEKGLKNDRDPRYVEYLANAYFFSNKINAAKPLYEELLKSNKGSVTVHLNYGRVLMTQGDYDEAIVQFNEFLKDHPNDVVAGMLVASCYSINERFSDTTLYEISEIPSGDFTGAFSPTEYREGLVFSAEKEVFKGNKQNPWTGNSYLDLYYIEKDQNGNWLSPELLNGDINGRFHEGPATFSTDGSTVYFTRSNYYKKKMLESQEDENNLKIFKATLVEDKWTNLEELPFNSDDYSCGHPTLSRDGNTIYFVSDKPGGYGSTDLYKSTLTDGVWGEPVNLGEELNTPGNEMFPYIHTDGTLYFSSNAHNSMGGLDVFITYNYNDRWMKPENLNYPLNTNKDDFGFILSMDNVTGFVSSTRTNEDELYKFEKHKPTFNLYGFAHMIGTETPVEGVRIEITRASDNKVISMVSDADGKFSYKLDTEETYNLYCTKIGCFARTDEISTVDLKYSQDFYANFEVEEIIIDKPIVLENIYYDFDEWSIREDAAIELNKLVRILKDNPSIHIEMGSHTDARGTDSYNLVLSDKRAKAAVEYLISQGISADRLTWKGYGETVPLNDCINGVECEDDAHQLNRRTEFKVKKK